MAPFHNEHLLADARARNSFAKAVEHCAGFANAIPAGEAEQAVALQRLIVDIGTEIRSGALRLKDGFAESEPVIRLYKAAVGPGRVKLQLFPLGQDDAHPPHAHYNLLSCQIVLKGRARVREYSLLRRLAGDELEIREEPEQILELGDGVFTLQKRNNIHWQEGLEPETVLLNINWQGFFTDTAMADDHAMHGRCYIDWDRARPAEQAGCFIVPEVVEAETAN